MVFQNYALYPHMTVYENMAFGLKLRRVPKARDQKRVTDAAALLGIEALLRGAPASFPADSGSGWPWAGRSCASRRYF